MCPGPGSQDSPVSDADHALMCDDRTAPVMSGGAWLTQDPVLPGRTGLLTQVCADDDDVALNALHPVQLWPPVRGSEVGREGAEESTWVMVRGRSGAPRAFCMKLLGLGKSRRGDGLSSPAPCVCPLSQLVLTAPASLGPSAGKMLSTWHSWDLRPQMAN